jgi:hypothetical protein
MALPAFNALTPGIAPNTAKAPFHARFLRTVEPSSPLAMSLIN